MRSRFLHIIPVLFLILSGGLGFAGTRSMAVHEDHGTVTVSPGEDDWYHSVLTGAEDTNSENDNFKKKRSGTGEEPLHQSFRLLPVYIYPQVSSYQDFTGRERKYLYLLYGTLII